MLCTGPLGLPPSQFWRMSPTEAWWWAEGKLPPKRYGSLSEADVKELYDAIGGVDG